MSATIAPTEKRIASGNKILLGQKVGMTQIFDIHGQAVPVTVVQAGPCHITRITTDDKMTYSSVQLAFGEVREKSVNKPDAGRFKKINVPISRWTREFRLLKPHEIQVGQALDVNVFVPGDYVDVSGTSKGKGFAGTVKRHHFGGGPSTHGQSDRQRAPGSIGSNTYPGHVFKGMRMAGHMGARRATVQHLEVVKVMPEQHVLLIKGALPGPNQSLLEIRQTVHRVKVYVEHPHEVAKKEKAAAKKEAKAAAPAAKAKPAK
jgi:large subunit ribosomal protein L3